MDKVVVLPDYFMLIIYIQLGWMGQVDQMLKGSSTRSKWLKSMLYETASKLAVKSGLIRKKPATLYRGIIINTITTDSLSTVKHHEKFSFASFSLNPEVACWFADPKSFMNSEMVIEGTDHLEGYVVEYAPDASNYLWHPSFADIAVTPVFEGGLGGQKFGYMEYAKMALSKKPELYSQFVWNVQTQQEVIIKPFGAKLKAHPISEYGCLSSEELNDKYTHPGFKTYLKSNPADYADEELKATNPISDIVYHGTEHRGLYNILKENRFKLSVRAGKEEEVISGQNTEPYFLSTTRSVTSSFLDQGKVGAVLELDGRKLNQRYKGRAVNFHSAIARILQRENEDAYNKLIRDDKRNTRDMIHGIELEDRIFSAKPEIPNAVDYIKKIHVNISSVDPSYMPAVSKGIREMYFMAKKYGIPIYFYEPRENFIGLKKPLASLPKRFIF